MLGAEAVFSQTGLIRCASVGLSDGAKSAYEAYVGTRGLCEQAGEPGLYRSGQGRLKTTATDLCLAPCVDFP